MKNNIINQNVDTTPKTRNFSGVKNLVIYNQSGGILNIKESGNPAQLSFGVGGIYVLFGVSSLTGAGNQVALLNNENPVDVQLTFDSAVAGSIIINEIR